MEITGRNILVVALAVCFCLAGCDSAEDRDGTANEKSERADQPMDDLVLVSEGKERSQIIVPENPSRMNLLAAEELQEYVRKISGAELPIVTKPSTDGSVNIFVGESEFTRELGISTDGLESDAFVMRTGESWLALVGNDADYQPRDMDALAIEDRARIREEWDRRTAPDFFVDSFGPYMDRKLHQETGWWQADNRGSLNAVYEFLRRQGVRWFMPGEIGEVVPQSASIVAAPVDEVIRPDFVLRHLPSRWDLLSLDDILWEFRLGLNYGHEFYGSYNAHGLNNVTGRDETKASHPEYYATWDGKIQIDFGHSGAQRLSSEELFEATVRFCRAVFDIYDEPAVEISLADNQGKSGMRSEHPDCVAQYTLERGRGILSDYYWSFLHRVAEEVYKTHPDKFIIGSAYQTQSLPPQNIDKLSPNVMVCIARVDRFRMGHEELQQGGTRLSRQELREQWAEKVPSGKIYDWEYYLFSRPNRGEWVGVPIYFSSSIAEDLRHMKSMSVQGEFLEVTRNQANDTPIHGGATPWGERGHLYAPGYAHLNLYLTARLYWDVDQDVDALLDDYCAKFFGPAARPMREFIAYCEENWPRMSPVSGEPEVRAEALQLLERARAAATTEPYAERVGFLAEYVQPMVMAQQLADQEAPAGPQVGAKFQTDWRSLKIDGDLSENLWRRTKEYRFGDDTQSGSPAPTSFRILFAEDQLFFGIHCEDPQESDSVAILLGSPAHSFYEIIIGRDGSVVTVDHKEGARPDWTAPIDMAVSEGDGYWTVEMKLPINTDEDLMVAKADGVVGRMPSPFAPWVFDVIRRQGSGENAPRAAFSGGSAQPPYDPAKFGELVVE